MKKQIILFIIIFCYLLTIFTACIKTIAYNTTEKLNGKTIFIDAGHGGNDNGANSNNVLEDEINLKISISLAKELIDKGAYVLMSRTGDYDLASLYQTNRKREDLKKRVQMINDSKPDAFISIHLNKYQSSSIEGAQVFFQNNEDSKFLANAIQNQLNILCSKKRNSKQGDYYILNNASYTGVIIECGFLSNDNEREKLTTESYQNILAKKISDALSLYFMKK